MKQSVCWKCKVDYPGPYDPGTWQHFLIRDEMNERYRAEQQTIVEVPYCDEASMPGCAPTKPPSKQGLESAYATCEWMGIEYDGAEELS